MTVKELKNIINDYPDNMEIIAYDDHFEDFIEVTDIAPCTAEGQHNGKLIVSLWIS